MNLFEINEQYRVVEEMTDLDPKTLQDTLDAIADAREVKLDNIAYLIEKSKMQADFLKDKIKELQEAKKILENKQKSLKEYMTSALDEAGLKELQTSNHILKTRNYKKSVIVDHLEDLPDEYKKTETVVKANSNALYRALMNGEDIKGAHLKDNRGTVIK
ncbi:siphovirus Gp157 family protein [Ligilactobacillus animalis]|uniref:siphovirus Gp157 family protein n=1 Tax=Ligilactobacillus animalis TaxID=1605 RepID=UPI0026E082C4|nr:siphovirus Gp157 family protein [Ligilactobacillus animalis]MDO5884175.1 siphovirus Gp157 family protein [Ligilactobacillus animalis]